MTKRDELIVLDPAGLEAAVRECARITAPEISDIEYERIRADNSPRYQNTRAEMERTLRAYLNAARSNAPGGVGVKVKLLEWQRIGDCWKADRYSIRIDHGVPVYYIVRGWDRGTNPHDTLDAAKAAAQADYERRILSALEGDAVLATGLVAGEAARFDFRAHLQRQREWSEKTFGTGDRAKGVVDHIRKELLEIEADPGDLKEWIDVVILALDGAWRSGAMPDQIIAALVGKQTRNEKREWPDWRTADPSKAIEHVRAAAIRNSGRTG